MTWREPNVAAEPLVRRPDQYVGERVKAARQDRGWRQADLVDRLHQLGATSWIQTKITKIENGGKNGGTKRLALADVLELAAALGVQPALLLSPADGDVQVAPKLRCSAAEFRSWLRSEKPLDPADERIYSTGKLVPDDEWRNVTITGVRATATATGKAGEVDAG
jgi:transcriptional regulator with XRE-family HTH domain